MTKLQIGDNDNRTHIREVMSALFRSEQTLTEKYTLLVPPNEDIEFFQRLDSLSSNQTAPDEWAPLHILPGRWTIEDLVNKAILNRCGNWVECRPVLEFMTFIRR